MNLRPTVVGCAAVSLFVFFAACSESDPPAPRPAIGADGGFVGDAGDAPADDAGDASDVTDGAALSDGGCVAGELRCQGTDQMRCDGAGNLQRVMTCPSGCANGQCVVGECGPTSTQCCIKYTDGSISCGGPQQSVYQACISGAESCKTPPNTRVASGVVVRTCNSAGQWAESDVCSDNCTAGSDLVTVGCGYCGTSGKAICVPNCVCE